VLDRRLDLFVFILRDIFIYKQSMDESMISSIEELKSSNWKASIIHFLTALVVIFLYNRWTASQSRVSWNAYRYQLAGPNTPDTCTTTGSAPIDPSKCNTEITFQQPVKVASINVIYGAIIFFLITAAAHAFYASDALGTGGYSKAILDGWNPYRWFEYSASASIMSVLIGLSVGTRDVTTLFALGMVTIAMQFNGFSVESMLRGPITRTTETSIQGSSYSGWILFLTMWTIIIYSFTKLISDVNRLYENDPEIKVPEWVFFIVIVQLIQYALFGLVQRDHIQSRLGYKAPKSYIDTEKSYIKLSYIAKLSLASGLSYGLLFRTKDC